MPVGKVAAVAISCAYCSGEHDTPAQVRQCWESGGRQDVPLSEGAPPASESDDVLVGDGPDTFAATTASASAARSGGSDARRPARPRSAASPPIERGAAPAGAGPDELARNIVVEPGQEVPAAWAACDRIVVDDDVRRSPAEVLEVLRAAHHGRTRSVIELHTDFVRRPMLMTEAEPHRLGPMFAFDVEELHHLVWANSVDARSPASPAWIGLDVALAHGASPADGAVGDVVLPDGTVAWLDGGPVRHTAPIDGTPVVHVVAVEHGSFTSPVSNSSSADLAPDQLAAVVHPGGGARIIAPAGSGKTRVLTERARHLITEWNLPPTAVSLVAFNKRAQVEMVERTGDLPGLQVRTLNAIALAIVNGVSPFAPQPRTWRTIDEPDVRRIIGDLVSFPRRRNSDPIAPWIEA